MEWLVAYCFSREWLIGCLGVNCFEDFGFGFEKPANKRGRKRAENVNIPNGQKRCKGDHRRLKFFCKKEINGTKRDKRRKDEFK